MIKCPIPKALRQSIDGVWMNRTPDHRSAYSHILLMHHVLYSFNEEKRSMVEFQLKKDTIFTELLGPDAVLLDVKDGIIYETEDQSVLWNLEYVQTMSGSGEELGRYVIPKDLQIPIAMHAVKEVAEGFISMKQLSVMKRLPCYVLVHRVGGITLFGERCRVHISYRDVIRPRVQRGYVKYLAEYPEDGRVYI